MLPQARKISLKNNIGLFLTWGHIWGDSHFVQSGQKQRNKKEHKLNVELSIT